MKICPECHKLSRDDDFCSHCGAAVYPDNTYSGSNISCDNYREFDGGREHTHEKESYSRPCANRPEHGAQPGGTYQRPPESGRPPVEGGRKGKQSGCITAIVVLFLFSYFFFSVIDSLDIDFWEWLGDVLELF